MLNMRNESGYNRRAYVISENGYIGLSEVKYD